MPIGLDFAALTRIDVIVALDMDILDLLANIFSLSFYEFIGKTIIGVCERACNDWITVQSLREINLKYLSQKLMIVVFLLSFNNVILKKCKLIFCVNS